MRKWIPAIILVLSFASAPAGKEKKMKPWTEWSQKDAQKILDESPWGQTQVEADVSEMFFTPTTGRDSSRAQRGALNQSVPMNFRIRFLSAKPIRQAFARAILSQQQRPDAQLEQGLRSFVERQFDQWIVVAVAYDSRDQRFSGPAMQMFNSATLGSLKNDTYLEVEGKRYFLEDYKAPIADGMGAKFIFPRMVDGQPVVKPESNDLRFYSKMSGSLTLNMKFKVSDFMYDGALEF